jgi:tetratricopeptide (TPR) repeat protein
MPAATGRAAAYERLEPEIGRKFPEGRAQRRRRPSCYPCPVRRYVIASLVLVIAAALGAAAYTAYAADREYGRLIATGDEAVSADQPFQALEAYSGAIAIRPEAMLAHLKRGMVYRSRGDLDEALKDLRRATELDPTATRPAELLGDTNMSLQRYDHAAARYETYLAVDDSSARVWYKLGLARYRAGFLKAAIEPLQRAIGLDKGLAEAHFVLGLCLRDSGQPGPAKASLETATGLAPGLTAPREALASLHMATGENARAIDQLEALAALDASRPERLVALGLAHARSRRYDAAVLALSRAVERFPDEPQVYAALGSVWLGAAEARDDSVALKKAIEALSTAASYSNVASDTLTDLGRALLLAGDAGAAERTLRRAVEQLPAKPEAYVHLSGLAAAGNRIQEARDALIRYVTLVGDSAPIAAAATQIAVYSLSLGEAHVALRWIDRTVDESGATPALISLRQRATDALRPTH